MRPNYFRKRSFLRKIIRDLIILVLVGLRLRGQAGQIRKSWKGRQSKCDRIAVVIAGGPSFTDDLAELILEDRQGIDVFALNFYCRSKWSERLVPDYYVLSDPAHLKPTSDEIAQQNAKLSDYLRRHHSRLCCPPGNGWNEGYKAPEVLYDDEEVLLSKNVDPRRPRGYPSNTAFKAIAIAQAMGYRKIFLLGLDYDYPRKLFLSSTNVLHVREEHHYGVKLADYSMHFEDVAHALNWWSHDFHHFRKLASPNTVNVTETSLVDFFPRMGFQEFKWLLSSERKRIGGGREDDSRLGPS